MTCCAHPPIVLFCDFGLPYTGQMKGRLLADAPEHRVIDLFHDVPAHDVRAGSVLLAAFSDDLPQGSVFVCVVDPGVGSATRQPGAVFAGGRWFIGPLNGVFEHVLRRWPDDAKAYEITSVPETLSSTFHGRDLFAPEAAKVANGDRGGLSPLDLHALRHPEFCDDVAEIIYADGFGNLMTGVRAATLGSDETVDVMGRKLPRVRTFSDVESGVIFCFENAVGLMEIAVNQGNAQVILQIGPSTPIKVTKE